MSNKPKSAMQQIADNTKNMGDKLNTRFNKTLDLKVAQTGLQAYKTAIAANKTILIYKKLTGTPAKLDHFE
jgi:hypothetical protein